MLTAAGRGDCGRLVSRAPRDPRRPRSPRGDPIEGGDVSVADSIESMQQDGLTIEPPEFVRERAYIKSREEYETMYKRSIEDPEGFWAEQAEEYLHWEKKWDSVLEYDFDKP